MGQPLPLDPIGGDKWTNYTTYQVTYTTRQRQVVTTTIFASSAAEAIAIVVANLTVQQLYGPITSVSAAIVSQPGNT